MIQPRPGAAMRRVRPSAWTAVMVLIAALILLPVLAVGLIALAPEGNPWPHLISTTLPRYLGNSVILVVAVGLGTSAVGAGTAWLVSVYRFPGVTWLQWALLLPLAVPAYVGAYALVDFLEYAGPVQTGLRSLFGWTSSRDYWFPEIRSRGAAALVLIGVLYPYVYLLARAAFRAQPSCTMEVARALGAGPWARFWRVGLPLARPAIATGAAIAMMETVSDFGVVDYFAVQTLTTGIFTLWMQASNTGGAAQIALVVLAAVLVLAALEKYGRGKQRYHRLSRTDRPAERIALEGGRAWAATLLCALPVLWGFALPVGVLLSHVADRPDLFAAPGLLEAAANTATVGAVAAVVTVAGALAMVYGTRLSGGAARYLLPVTSLGYATPGAVLGIGLLIPLVQFDQWLADGLTAVTGSDPGLLLTGSAVVLIYAYAVRFFAIAQGAAEAAFGRVSPSLPMAARALGRGAGGTLRAVYLPLMGGTLGSALLLVFVDCAKELPATLLLRPFGFDTLATRTYEQASLEQIADATPPALMVILVSLGAVLLLARNDR